MVKHGGHQGIPFLFTDSVILWQPHCTLRVMRTTAYLKAIMEVGMGPLEFIDLSQATLERYKE